MRTARARMCLYSQTHLTSKHMRGMYLVWPGPLVLGTSPLAAENKEMMCIKWIQLVNDHLKFRTTCYVLQGTRLAYLCISCRWRVRRWAGRVPGRSLSPTCSPSCAGSRSWLPSSWRPRTTRGSSHYPREWNSSDTALPYCLQSR